MSFSLCGNMFHLSVCKARVLTYKPRPLRPPGTGDPVCLPVDLGFQPSENTHKLKHYLRIITDNSPAFH